jgi:hypothetical protein
MRYTIVSDPSEEDLVADLIYDDEGWGAITRRGETYALDLYPKRDRQWSFRLDDALAILTAAYERLRSLEKSEG